MVVLDSIFFATELGVGLWVSSLALMADAFHMVRNPRTTRNDYVLSNVAERHHLAFGRIVGCQGVPEELYKEVLLWSKYLPRATPSRIANNSLVVKS